jgi:hypothetical protein
MPSPTLNVDRIKALADRLKRTPRLANHVKRRGDTTLDEEAWQVATALSDVEESTARLFGELVPKLLKSRPRATKRTTS